MNRLKGMAPIIATPFTASGEVDYGSFENLVETLIKGGCQAVTLFGIAGEYYKLSQGECDRLVRLTVDTCRRLNGYSIISVTHHATEVAVKYAKRYEEAGADMLMLLPPFFLKPGAASLYEHMKAVGNAVSIPVMTQYAPEQTGVGIAPEVFGRLFREVPNISYYKIECKPVGMYITRLLEETKNEISVFVGNAGYQFIEAFDRGAVGAMPGCSMYDFYLKMYREYESGDRSASLATHSNLLLPMLNHIRQDVEMIIYYEKRILQKRGIIATDYCRNPSFVNDGYHDRIFEELFDQISPYFTEM
ncbi:MAG: dihydrodipicolinate synthase family protein [Sphaerochaeta sp.]|nr:dihydrodipicolinate synthase family protein [Sphaerochaeta sp.]